MKKFHILALWLHKGKNRRMLTDQSCKEQREIQISDESGIFVEKIIKHLPLVLSVALATPPAAAPAATPAVALTEQFNPPTASSICLTNLAAEAVDNKNIYYSQLFIISYPIQWSSTAI